MTTKALDRVKEALAMGAATRKEIQNQTLLAEDIVDLCVDILIDTGSIKPTQIKGACTIGGCRSCAEDSTCHPRENKAGPITISISKRPE